MITPKKQKFAEEYVKDLNATQAALRAGYSAKTAYSQGQRLLKDVEVQALVRAAQKKASETANIDAAYVMRRMAEIDTMDVIDIMNDDMTFKPLSQWPKIWRQYLSGVDIAEMFEGLGDARRMVGLLKKIKWPDKTKNLEMLARTQGVFKDSIAVTGKDGVPLPMMIFKSRAPKPEADVASDAEPSDQNG